MKPKKVTNRELRYKQKKYWNLFEWLIFEQDDHRGGYFAKYHSYSKTKDKTGKLPYVLICIYNFPIIGKFSVNVRNHRRWWCIRYAKSLCPYSRGPKWITTKGGRRKRKNKQRLTPNTATRMRVKRELLKLKQFYASNNHD